MRVHNLSISPCRLKLSATFLGLVVVTMKMITKMLPVLNPIYPNFI